RRRSDRETALRRTGTRDSRRDGASCWSSTGATDHYIGGHIRRKPPPHGESPSVPDAVIFDCDGVLVDSELIFARVLAECLIAVDFPTTIDEAITLGFGRTR